MNLDEDYKEISGLRYSFLGTHCYFGFCMQCYGLRSSTHLLGERQPQDLRSRTTTTPSFYSSISHKSKRLFTKSFLFNFFFINN